MPKESKKKMTEKSRRVQVDKSKPRFPTKYAGFPMFVSVEFLVSIPKKQKLSAFVFDLIKKLTYSLKNKEI